jgi:hypothetical protein
MLLVVLKKRKTLSSPKKSVPYLLELLFHHLFMPLALDMTLVKIVFLALILLFYHGQLKLQTCSWGLVEFSWFIASSL